MELLGIMGRPKAVAGLVNTPHASPYVLNGFVPTVTFAAHDDDFESTACVYNYFSDLFPERRSGATAHAWAFDATGECLGHVSDRLPFQGQTRVGCDRFGKPFFGAIAVSLIPDELPEKRPAGVGTGYYVQYRDRAGHIDHSHEWDPMRFKPMRSVPWLCVVRPRLASTRLVVLNSYFGEDAVAGRSLFAIRLRNHRGEILASCDSLSIPIRGCWKGDLAEFFPELQRFADQEPLAVDVSGDNVMGPFTVTRGPGGDFNVHHFC